MGTYRMYTDAPAKARWEAIDLAKTPDWLAGLDTTQIKFGSRPPGVIQDWHPAPQRQFVIILSGRLEIGFEDGSKKVFGPGDARLVEDTTGKGHTTIALGDEPCITATIGLKDQG
ncbi:MAG: cupin domain-containing protein [Dehalococcoidia bacterium]|nr:cupin domain-containing protein [Dehalococcoidia bacterium]